MAIQSNRSPSPLSSKRTHQSKNSDSSSAPRRSFTGNQSHRPPALSNPRHSFGSVTPANSPASGFGRKTSPVYDEKENEKDLTPAKSLPAAMTVTKNFMAPTISAASKFTPSPRQKKVLAERNDPVRTSITLSDGKATFYSGLESPVGNTEQKDDVVSTSKASKKVTFSDDCVSKTTTASSPIIAPLDADPFVLPYDPKTNFLSPRPQFLHYKPIPRVEVVLDQEMGDDLGIPRSLEDNLLEVLSESFSDTDGTEESSCGDDSQKGSEDVLPEGAEEDDLHVPAVGGVMEESEGELIPNSPEIDGVSAENVVEAMEEEVVEAVNNNGRQKKSFWKPVVMLLVLLLTGASLWADVSPFLSTSVLETLESPKIGFLRKEDMEELGLRFQKLSFDSISRLSLLMNRLGGGGEGHFVGDVHFVSLNLTTDSEDHSGLSMCLKEEQKMPQQMKEDIEEEEEQSESEVEIQEPELDFEDTEEWESEDFSDESVTDPAIVDETSLISGNVDHPIFETDMNVTSEVELSSADKEPENADPIFEADMNVTSETVHSNVSPANLVELSSADEEPEFTSETVKSASPDEQLQDSVFQIIAPLVAAIVFAAAATFFFWKRSTRVSAMDYVTAVSNNKLQEEVFEEESGSSEMSSSRSEVHSHKRARRRDSTASSSSELSLYSYGSFTTYEKIPSKHKASGEGELLTPVRRSSRFRNNVSS